MLKNAHLFFKPVIFLFLVLLLANVQQEHNLYKTVPVVLGILLVYSSSIVNQLIQMIELIEELLFKLKYFLVSVFESIANLVGLIFLVIFYPFKLVFSAIGFIINPATRVFGSFKRDKYEDQVDCGEPFSSGTDYQRATQADQEEAVKQAKDEFRRARGEQDDKDDVAYTPNTSAREDTRSYHEILGLPQNFNREDLKKAYKTAVSKYHPDHHQHMPESFRKEAEAELVKVNRAYNYLLNLL